MTRVSILGLAVIVFGAGCSFDPVAEDLDPPAEPVCGNGRVEAGEDCDDNNRQVGDGCYECVVISGWTCDDREPSRCENPPPTVGNDEASVEAGGTVFVDVLENDSDPKGEVLHIAHVTRGNLGTASIEGNQIKYVANAGVMTSEIVVYTVGGDGGGASPTGRLTILIGITNRPPTAADVVVVVPANVTTAIRLEGTDPEGGVLTYSIATAPDIGTVDAIVDADALYTPPTGYTGMDTFTYRAADRTSSSASATVSIRVGDANWWDTFYTRRREVTINSNSLRAATNVPVRVPLNSGALMNEGAADLGADIRFRSTDNNIGYPHEITNWGTALAAAWVMVPNISGVETKFWMYYANPTRTMEPVPPMWSSTFDAVFHLESSLYESATNVDVQSGGNYVDTLTGRGRALASDERLDLPVPNGRELNEGGLCAWLMLEAGERREVWRIDRGSSGSGGDASLRLAIQEDERLEVDVRRDENSMAFQSGLPVADGLFHFVCVSWASSQLRLIVDGAEVGTGSGFSRFDIDGLRIGEDNEDNFRGPFDEVWLYTGPRTDDWSQVQYRLGRDALVFVSTPAEQVP